jgi:alpha-L-fucosidase
LKLGVSSHRAFNWSYYTFETNFDTNNARFSGLYGTPHAPTPRINSKPDELRQTVPTDYLQDWYGRTIQIVDQYQPDLMWFDFCFEGPEWEPYRKAYAAYYYNRAEAWQKGVVVNYKHDAYPPQAAVLDIERGLLQESPKYPWQTDTSVSWESWGYIQNDRYKTPGELVRELIDIVSKNGCLLLNVGPTPDGRIPDPAEQTLLAMGQWLSTNGEAIYGTRPWKLSDEGPTKLNAGQFGEKSEPAFTAQDIRFTAKPDAVYAIALAWPEKELVIQSFGSKSASGAGIPAGSIEGVRLLGSDARLDWKQTDNGLRISAPSSKSGDFAYVFKVSLKNG